MTESEALDMLKVKLKCTELDDLACIGKGCDRKCDDCDLNYEQGNHGRQKEAMKMAISALEKQIPKKPVMKNDDGIECDSGMPPYCPTCGIELTDRIPFDNKDFYFHCLNCGQALDWTDIS